ncbi:MAG: hypothetical protein AAB617_02770 [Patescibacteria group bacterium]
MDSQDSRNGYGPLVLRLIIAVMLVSVVFMVFTSPGFTKATVATQSDTMPTKQLVGPVEFRTLDAVALIAYVNLSSGNTHDHRKEDAQSARVTVMEVASKYLYADIRDGKQKFENEILNRLGDRLWRTGSRVDSIWVLKVVTATR